ncbi:MAG: 30S ribosomal protein S16 [Chloroflexota bacterium]
MPVRIRLSRVGATKRPSYRVVAIDSRRPRDGRALEILGFYDPLTEPATVQIDAKRFAAWVGKGALPSDTVAKLIKINGSVPGPKATSTDAPAVKAPRARKPSAKATAKAAAAAKAEAEPAAAAEPVPASAGEAEPEVPAEATNEVAAEATAEATSKAEPEAEPEAEPGAAPEAADEPPAKEAE